MSLYFATGFGLPSVDGFPLLTMLEVVAMFESYAVTKFEKLLYNGRILNSLNIPLSVETVCVFTAPIFSAFASWATYLLTKVFILTETRVLRICVSLKIS